MSTIDPPQWLASVLDAAPVVLIQSRLSDVRGVRRKLEANGVAYREVILDMGDTEGRDRFQSLQAYTGWSTLPQTFHNGRFVGGPEELAAALGEWPGERADPGAAAAPGPGPSPSPHDRRGAGFALLGVVPLVVAGLWLAFADPRWHGWVLQALVHYLALALAFAGALQWRDAVKQPGLSFWRQATLAAGPALYAWIVLMLPILAEAALLLLAVGFIALYIARRSMLFHSAYGR